MAWLVFLGNLLWDLLCLAEPAAEADGVEEAAVAQGSRVAAAVLGQAALGELGAAGLHGDHSHFGSGRRNGAFGRSGGLFRLLGGGAERRSSKHLTPTKDLCSFQWGGKMMKQNWKTIKTVSFCSTVWWSTFSVCIVVAVDPRK